MENRKVIVPNHKGGISCVLEGAIMMSRHSHLLDGCDRVIVHSFWEVGNKVELAIELQSLSFWGAVEKVKLMNILI